MTKKQEQEVAIHEAAHAVARVVLGLKFRWIRIGVRTEKQWIKGKRYPEQVEIEERGGIYGVNGGLNRARRRHEAGLPLTPAQALRVRQQMISLYAASCAVKKLRGRFNWRGASGDLAHTQEYAEWFGDDAEAVITESIEAAWWIVDNHTGYIEAVAQALLERRTLSRQQVQEIMDTLAKKAA